MSQLWDSPHDRAFALSPGRLTVEIEHEGDEVRVVLNDRYRLTMNKSEAGQGGDRNLVHSLRYLRGLARGIAAATGEPS